MDFLISKAYAADAPQQGGGFEMLIMLAVFGVVFYFHDLPSTSKAC